jgi:hypothetical protein
VHPPAPEGGPSFTARRYPLDRTIAELASRRCGSPQRWQRTDDGRDTTGSRMDLVVIVGAGATLAEAISHRPRQSREHPPLDTNFFSKAESVTTHALSLRRAARAAGLDDPFRTPEPRMEDFFGDVYYEITEGGNTAARSPAMEVVSQSAAYLHTDALRYDELVLRSTPWRPWTLVPQSADYPRALPNHLGHVQSRPCP